MMRKAQKKELAAERDEQLKELAAERDEAVKETEHLKREGSRQLAAVRQTLEAAAAERSRAAHAEHGGLEAEVQDLRREREQLFAQMEAAHAGQGSLAAEVQELRTEKERLLQRLDVQDAGTARLKRAAEKEEEARRRVEEAEREAQEASLKRREGQQALREAEAKGEAASRKRREAEAAKARLLQDSGSERQRAEEILEAASLKRREGHRALRQAEAKEEVASLKRREGQQALREAEAKGEEASRKRKEAAVVEARLALAQLRSKNLGCEVKELQRKLASEEELVRGTREELVKARGEQESAIKEAAEMKARMQKERKFLGVKWETAPWALISAPNAVPFSREVLVHSRNEHGELGEDVEFKEEGEEYMVRLSTGEEVQVRGSDLKFRGSSCYDFFRALLSETEGVGSFDCVWIPDIQGCWGERFPKDREQHQGWVCTELSKHYQCKEEGKLCGGCAWFHHWAENVRNSQEAGQELRFAYLERPLCKEQPRFRCEQDGKEYFVGKAQLVELTWVQEKMGWPVKPTRPDAILQEFLGDFQVQCSLEQELSEERARRQELQSTLERERAQQACERAQREEEAQQTLGTLDMYEEARAARRSFEQERKLEEKEASTLLQQRPVQSPTSAEKQRPGRRWSFWWRRRRT